MEQSGGGAETEVSWVNLLEQNTFPTDGNYYYSMDEMSQTPAAFEMTAVPTQGKMFAETCTGGRREIKVGDQVSAEEIESLQYDPHGECGENQKCQDTFTYKALSNWQGKGQEKTLLIDFNLQNSEALVQNSALTGDCAFSGMSNTALYIICITASVLLTFLSLVLYKRNKDLSKRLDEIKADAQNQKAAKADNVSIEDIHISSKFASGTSLVQANEAPLEA